MLKKLVTHSLLYALAPQISRIASVLLLPIITKHVTQVDYGIYGLLVAYLCALNGLKDLGLAVVFVNTFYKHKKRWPIIWRALHGHLIIWSFIFALLMLALLKIAIPAEAKKDFWTIAALTVIPALLFDNTNFLGNYYYRFMQKPFFISVVSVTTGIATVLTTYFCIVNLELGYLGWFVASFVSSVIMFSFYSYPVYMKLKLFPILKIRRKFIMSHLKVALPMVPHNYSSYLLNSSDRVIMKQLDVNIGQIGLYNMAYTFGSYFEVLGEALGMAVGPYYSKLYTDKSQKAQCDERNLTFFLMICFLLATFLTSIWLKEIFKLLISNSELRTAYGIGIIIIMGYAYRPMYWSAGIKLSIFKHTSSLWRISFSAGIINVILNVILVPRYGILAAALSTLVSLLFIGFSGYFFTSYKRLDGLDHFPIFWMIAIVILTIIAYSLKDSSMILKTIITVGLLGIFVTTIKINYSKLMAIDV